MLIDAHSHLDRYDLVDEQALGSALAEITQHRILTISNSMDLPSLQAKSFELIRDDQRLSDICEVLEEWQSGG